LLEFVEVEDLELADVGKALVEITGNRNVSVILKHPDQDTASKNTHVIGCTTNVEVTNPEGVLTRISSDFNIVRGIVPVNNRINPLAASEGKPIAPGPAR
jgi:hypothetical protein